MKTRRFRQIISAASMWMGAFAVLLAATRPWHRRWGASDEEIAERLVGDDESEGAAANHAITINAPVDQVWPWLVQIGQDRGGFYSYSWLENLVGADIHNVDRIVPEFQSLKVGDRVRLASPERYGDGPLLRVTHLEPGRSFVLERWGAFVLKPIDDHRTRLIIRTHRTRRALPQKVLDFFVGEPVHFIMERKMLLGIKERAERTARTVTTARDDQKQHRFSQRG